MNSEHFVNRWGSFRSFVGSASKTPAVDPARDAEPMTLIGEAPLIDDRGRINRSVDPTDSQSVQVTRRCYSWISGSEGEATPPDLNCRVFIEKIFLPEPLGAR